MKRIALHACILALSAIPRAARAEAEAAKEKAPPPSLEARADAAAAKVAALADAMKKLAGAKDCERAEILAELRRAFAAPPVEPAGSRAVMTIESRHVIRRIGAVAPDAPAPSKDPAAEERERMAKEIRELQARVEELQRRLAEAEKREDARARSAEIPRLPAWIQETPPIPKIDGRVVGVSKKINLLVISVGEEDGVKIGFEFTIFRGSTYVGKMVIEKVYPRQSAGRVIMEKTKEPVLVGDCVSTKFE